MSPEEFYAHAMRAADAEGRLPLSRMTGWDIFPSEQADLRVVPLAPVLPVPSGQHDRDAATIAQAIIASYGGRPHPVTDDSENAAS